MIEALIWALTVAFTMVICCGTIFACVISDNRRKTAKIEADKRVEMEREATKQGMLTLQQEKMRIEAVNAGMQHPPPSNPFELS